MRRREFLAVLSAGVAGACRFPGAGSATTPLGIQLYTLRKEMAADVDGTLARVADIGFREVEFAGYFGRAPSAIRAALDRVGLRASACHEGTAATFLRDIDRTLDAAKAIGHEWVICSWIDNDQRSLDHYRRHADTFNRAGELARRAGLRFAYHNHDFALARTDGVLPYDLLLERTDPALVDFEMDVFWVRKGGGDPLAYLARWPGRFPLLHLKDMDAGGAMVDAGDGSLDFARLIDAARRGGTRHFFFEHDEPAPDGFTSARRSFAYLSALDARR